MTEPVVVVAGHASFRESLTATPAEPARDDHWALKPYQAGEPAFFIQHIRAGVEAAAASRGLLVFSGGITTAEAGHWSEARTYYAIAKHFQWWSHGAIASRTMTEECARDSFENLLFSMFACYQARGGYPTSMVVISWEFKRARFELHRDALRIPAERFQFIGVGNPPRLQEAVRGETAAIESFSRDPWGRQPPLRDKRRARSFGPCVRRYTQCPGAARIFTFLDDAATERPGPGPLPWEG